MTAAVITGAILAFVGWVTWAGIRQGRRYRAAKALIRQITKTEDTLGCIYSQALRFQVVELNGKRSRWQPFVIAVTPARVAIYGLRTPLKAPSFTLTPDQLRWFGRPKKYSYLRNEIWLHGEIEGRWMWVRLRLYREEMQALVRALKAFATPEQVIAYRRRRPYIHFGPVTARPAAQDVHGAWALDEPVSLYLMPTCLVMLDGIAIRENIALKTIQGVSAIRRADQVRSAGLVRFEADGRPLAFALKPYEAFAMALGAAARHTLEDPVEWLGRKKKKADGWEDDEEFS
jgi:hypothetical protein